MKYQHEIRIALPKEKVIELFDNPDNLPHWQEGFVSLEHLSGNAGEAGAKSRLKYKMGKREIEMTETILKREPSGEFRMIFEARGVWNKNENYFEALSETETKWLSVNEFKFKGFMKLMGFLMPGAFRKQSLKYMKDFKEFAEKAR